MIPLTWTLLAVSVWTCGSGQILLQENVKILYPKLNTAETVECDCSNFSCDVVFWFRSVFNADKVEYIGKCTNAERVVFGTEIVDKNQFALNKKGSKSFVLRISRVTEADAGIYSCVLRNRSNHEMWKPGTLLRPGVTPPTEPPKINPKRPVKPACPCSGINLQQGGCGSLVLWPLVGLITALTLVLFCVLYYFSRLPKKCRHHFVKKRPMS